jgi:hypothetical protein
VNIDINHFVLAGVLAFAAVPAGHAADPPEQPASSAAPAAVDEEEQLDEGLKRFGYLAGLARGCVVEKQRVDLEREVLDLHAGIARLLGTDRAFLFAAAFGYGTTDEIGTKECVEVLETYERRVEKFRASRGGAR